jgi:hypothetical protein
MTTRTCGLELRKATNIQSRESYKAVVVKLMHSRDNQFVGKLRGQRGRARRGVKS